MSDHSTAPGQPAFVLVRPQMGENIGAAARAMWNFGLDRMRVVGPRDGWPNSRAVAMASGAGRLLDEAALHDDLEGAIADCHFVLATTARSRDLTKPVFTPEAAVAETRARIAAGQRVAILFGPERTGLENADVVRANAIVTVPVNPAFPSLNLAQCALLLAYEWGRQGGDMRVAEAGMDEDDAATAGEIDRLGAHFEERLDQAGFFFPADKGPHMRMNLRNMLSRLPLTRGDVQTFHGMLRQFARRMG